jgi:Bacterial SH3 domain
MNTRRAIGLLLAAALFAPASLAAAGPAGQTTDHGDQVNWIAADCAAHHGTAKQCRCFERGVETTLSPAERAYLSLLVPDVADPLMGMEVYSFPNTWRQRAWLKYARATVECAVGMDEDEPPPPVPLVTEGSYVLEGRGAVHASPNASSALIEQLPAGTELDVLGEVGGGWVRVRLGQENGFLTREDFRGAMRVAH